MLKIQTQYRLIAVALFVLTLSVLSGGKARAATITVATGTDETTTNSSCSLSEAIRNINDQAATNPDCAAGDGVDDTIVIPAGTITLAGNLEGISRSVTIQGAGIGQTVIDGNNGQWQGLQTSGGSAATQIVNNLTITAFRMFGIAADDTNLIMNNVEIDGANAQPDAGGNILTGVSSSNNSMQQTSLTASNIYIHGLSAEAQGVVGGILTTASASATVSATLQNVSISNLENTSGQAMGVAFVGGLFVDNSPSSITASVDNLTVVDISSNLSVVGLAALSTVNDGTSSINIDVTNATITGLFGGTNPGFGTAGAGLAVGGAAILGGDASSITMTATNVMISDVGATTQADNCTVFDLNGLFGAAGAVTVQLISNGGNLSDNTTCSDSFTHPKDKNNITSLASTIAGLADNGGTIPTLALLPSSPAIDAGVAPQFVDTGLNALDVSVDARGVSRPQCVAYDSGAYEYNGTCPPPNADGDTIPDATEIAAPNNGDGNNDGVPDKDQSNVSSLPAENGTYVTLVAPEGVTINSTTVQQARDLAKQDSGVSYPLGVVNFTATTTAGATIPVELYFYTDSLASTFTARKYNTTTQTYADIAGAVLTDVTVGGKHAVKLTYSITDGGALDQDGQANGTIVDPVGLATASSLAKSGQNVAAYLTIATGILAGVMLLVRRKHRLYISA